ncbi:MAG TPA: thiamine phosphate synthase [Candidatus Polarisedimenticolaceae bacterium]|nr:thiamine phosphate synthase [Candidatus Polarisedimenticolaceae bacterium]
MTLHKALMVPALYAILDPEQISSRSPESVLRELLQGGVKMIQLRAKAMSSRDFFQLAQRARELTAPYDCKLIVNDRIDIALGSAADGVHLGQEDLPLQVGRKLLGDRLIGISTHSLEQANEAEANGADYIGFGPLFGTATKNTGYTARGLEMLARIRAAVALPIVAIGGITEANIRDVWQAGADSAAIISDILKAEEVAAKVRAILAAAELQVRS